MFTKYRCTLGDSEINFAGATRHFPLSKSVLTIADFAPAPKL